MHIILITLLIIASIGIIAVVLLQSGKSEGLSGAITGGAEQLFGKQKARGLDKVLHRITLVCSIVFFVAAFILAYYIK
ncbi:preprotein translocase subunit SecG [Camelliibacillus cellulosilyticus]|uniref:Protein-export membrane protein SecG n=1 Tax=Camelliibacillus cellulosilyticus TaxID=2174486 RepID=A0ABV9GNT9_9BACL